MSEPPAQPTQRPSRSALKDAEARAALQPLAPGERPRAVTVAAVIAGALAASQVIAWLFTDLGERNARANFQSASMTLILIVCAIGMWRTRYWAVMGFQTLLALSAVIAALSLAVASNLAAGLISLAIVVSSGTMFWYLVRALARIQMPTPPGFGKDQPSQ